MNDVTIVFSEQDAKIITFLRDHQNFTLPTPDFFEFCLQYRDQIDYLRTKKVFEVDKGQIILHKAGGKIRETDIILKNV